MGLAGLPVAYLAAITTGAAVLLYILRKRLYILKATAADGVHADDKNNTESLSGAQKSKPDGAFTGIMPLSVRCLISTGVMLAALIASEFIMNAISGAAGDGANGVTGGVVNGIPGAAADGASGVTSNGMFNNIGISGSAYNLTLTAQITRLAVQVFAGGAAYAAASYVFGVTEIRAMNIKKLIKK